MVERKKSKARTDCFAYMTGDDAVSSKCMALSVMECKCNEGKCPFYKPLNQELDELQRINGVISIEAAIKEYTRYASQKTKGEDANNEQ